MKNIIFFIVFMILSATFYAQEEQQFFDQMLSKDYSSLNKYFDSEVEFYLDDYEDMINSREAAVKLEVFFNEHPPISYNIRHKGKSKGKQSNYYVCDLRTGKGSYRLFVYFDKKGNGSKICELRLESN